MKGEFARTNMVAYENAQRRNENLGNKLNDSSHINTTIAQA
jgi:hypothetical protein